MGLKTTNILQLIRLKYFLFKYQLETGCLIIGWLSLVHFGFFFIGIISSIIYLSQQDFVGLLGWECCDSAREQMLVNFVKGATLGMMLVFSLIFLIIIFVSVFYINSLKERNFQKLKMMRTVLATVAILMLALSIYHFETSTFVDFILHAYSFVCVNSLYYNFKEESSTRDGSKKLPPKVKVIQ